jgi:hypothetical protein
MCHVEQGESIHNFTCLTIIDMLTFSALLSTSLINPNSILLVCVLEWIWAGLILAEVRFAFIIQL